MSEEKTLLTEAREEINRIDTEMARLFRERMIASGKVAQCEKDRGMPVFDPVREEEVLRRGDARMEGETLRSYYVNFLRANMDISKAYQSRLLGGMRVAYSGVKGAFAQLAASRIFPDAECAGYGDFAAAYQAVENGESDVAVLPLENSTGGDVGTVMDLAFFGSLKINGIYDIEVVQNLLAVKGAALIDIKQVVSHPQALGQCADYIRAHGFEAIEAINTAVAAKMVAESGRTDIAAIGSDEAAAEYGLQKLEGNINRSSKNTTRFAVFTRSPVQASVSHGRFIMTFTVNNEAGSLGRAVSVIGRNGFNLRALKSRPTKSLQWDYYFFVEGDGNIDGDAGKNMLRELEGSCNSVRVLGSFDKEINL